MNAEELRQHLAVQTYDKNYQAIECLGVNGYSHSNRTWRRIQSLVNWKGCTVVDLGCFHGYFSLRAEEAGAGQVIGLDAHEGALVTARMIAEIEGTRVVTYREWTDEKPIPAADITLCLNALHHFKQPEVCLKNMSGTAVFEVPTTQLPLITSVFKIIEQRASHRRGRVLFSAKKL